MSTSVELIEVEFIPQRSEFFKYIIYVPKSESDGIIVENCETQKIARSSISDLNRYIRTLKANVVNNVMYRRIDSLDVFDMEVEDSDENNTGECKITNADSFMFVDFPQYVTIKFYYDGLKHVDKAKIPMSQNFFVVNDNYFCCRVPYLATFVWHNKHRGFYRLMFYHNEEFYQFPYGNVSTDGHICCKYVNEQLVRKFITGFNSMFFNSDYSLPIKGASISLEHLVDFNREKIISKMEANEDINILNIFYVLSEMTIDEVPWDKWFCKAPLSWFKGNRRIKDECINLAKSILGE